MSWKTKARRALNFSPLDYYYPLPAKDPRIEKLRDAAWYHSCSWHTAAIEALTECADLCVEETHPTILIGDKDATQV